MCSTEYEKVRKCNGMPFNMYALKLYFCFGKSFAVGIYLQTDTPTMLVTAELVLFKHTSPG